MAMVNTALIDIVEPASQTAFGSEVIVSEQQQQQQNRGVYGSRQAGNELCGKRKRNRNWTHSEVLLLIEGKKNESEALDNGSCISRDKMVSSSEKWKRIVEHMKRNGIDDRDVAQCRGKWDNLLSDYKTIKGVLKKSGRQNYFSMSIEERRKEDPTLPCYFDKDLFERLDSFLSGRLHTIPATFTDMSTNAQSAHAIHVRTEKASAGEHELGSGGKKKKQAGTDVVQAITKLTNTYMAAVASMEEKRDTRHRELLQFEREKLQVESRDRRELAAQLSSLAMAFNRVADNLKDV